MAYSEHHHAAMWISSAMLVFLLSIPCCRACTIVAVGKDASATGHPIVTHSDDSGTVTTDVRFVRVPRKQWPEGSQRATYQWRVSYPRVVNSALPANDYHPVGEQVQDTPLGYIPQVKETWAYWDTDYGVQNEWGLSIGESTCSGMTYGWPATPDRSYGYNRVGIEDLTKIAMERCTTARCAITTMGSIAEELGFYAADGQAPSAFDKPAHQGSSECLALADATPGDVWVFHILTGRNNASAIWAAQRIPSDHVVAIANAFTIRKMNLSDADNNLYSPGVTKLAQDMGWWRPDQETSTDLFDFASAYGYTPPAGGLPWDPPNTEVYVGYYSGRRMWRIFSLLSPDEGAKLDPNTGNMAKARDAYPVSVRAGRGSITVRMVMDVHRDHYEGTPYDLTKGMAAGPHGNPNRGTFGSVVGSTVGRWERAISMFRTSWSFVLEPKPDRRSVTWFGWDSPHGTAYLPFFGAATEGAPISYHTHEACQSKFSTKVAWWAFNLVNQFTELNFKVINADVRAKARSIEDRAFQLVQTWDGELQSSDDAFAKLTTRSNAFVEASVSEWWDYAWSLIAKYGRYVVTYNESQAGGVDSTAQNYPEWWLRDPEVGFSKGFDGLRTAQGTPIELYGQPNVPLLSGLAITLFFGMLFIIMIAFRWTYLAGVRHGQDIEGSANPYLMFP